MKFGLEMVARAALFCGTMIQTQQQRYCHRRGAGWLSLVMALSFCHSAPTAKAAAQRWVGTWGCGPQLTERNNLPPEPLANSTLRQFVRVSLGGKRLRARFSNVFGTNSVMMNTVHVALAADAASGHDGAIHPASDKALRFHGARSVTIPAGAAVLSDPFEFDLPPRTNLAVSIYLGDISATTLTGHPGSRTTSFIQPGNSVSASSLPAAAKTPHWYLLTGIDVEADRAAQAVVILGDSISDGRGSTTDANNRWPDALAKRFGTNAATSSVAVLNMGIGGNGVFGGLGPSARDRFSRDVLNQSGARWLILFEGVNDIGRGISAHRLTNAYAQLVEQAHGHNLRAYGATITPFGKSFYDRPAHEAVRQAVNDWIRTSGNFDAVIDFDAVVRDPAIPSRLLPAYDTGDHLHLNPSGYQAMANAIDLSLFTHQ